jgi:hypothetical protein
MKLIYSVMIIITASILFAWTKSSPAAKPASFTFLNGTWYGQYSSENDRATKPLMFVFKENGKMLVYEGDTCQGDKAKGTYMLSDSILYGNYQFIQDGPVINIQATVSATKITLSGAWYCGADGGTFAAMNPLPSPQRSNRDRQEGPDTK